MSTPLDPAEEERLRSRCLLETIGGKYKGRVYGVGRVDRQDVCVGRYLQETQTSSSNKKAYSEEIFQLRQHIERMDARFQNFQDFMMQYLPPEAAAATQHIFSSQIPRHQLNRINSQMKCNIIVIMMNNKVHPVKIIIIISFSRTLKMT